MNDYANLLTPAQEADLSTIYESLEQEIGCQVAALIIEKLPPVTIERYSLAVANAWQLGRKGVDDGLLFTIAVQDRRSRIEVGLGLELVISDELAAQILERMGAEFSAGRFFEGLRRASLEAVTQIRQNSEQVGKRRR